MIYLYVKIHNKTGLKYLGKTEKCPDSYYGSGKRWIRHLDKHGYDVRTYIIYKNENIEKIREMGIYYSNLWNIVESDEWANLIVENGSGGDTSKHINYDAIRKTHLNTLKNKYGEEITNISQLETVKEKKKNTLNERYGVSNPSLIPEVIEKKSRKLKKIKNDEAWKNSTGKLGYKKVSETMLSDEWKKDNYRTCEHCGKTCNIGNYSRWHGDKCKSRK